MSESRVDSSHSTNSCDVITGSRKCSWSVKLVFTALAPVVAAIILYRVDSFDPAPLPPGELPRQVVMAPSRNAHLLRGSEMVGVGQLLGPEDLAYCPESQLIYTGCADGWIKRVTVNDSVVENWVNTGGRPLGLVVGRNNELIVADADKGLLRVSESGEVEQLTKEAEGVEFRLTDGVDMAHDGMIYFTDASSKYSIKDFNWDLLEGRPHGRLMSYNPSTKQTQLLLHHLYFANGVAVSPDQTFLVFCETPMRRCKKYYIQGDRKGSVAEFIQNLPGIPDNIRYDGDGHYWIALAMGHTFAWDLAQRYPFIRKAVAMMERYVGRPGIEKDGGVLAVDLEGKPVAHYYDPRLSLVTSGIKIGDHLYSGSAAYQYIIRLNLTQYPALAHA